MSYQGSAAGVLGRQRRQNGLVGLRGLGSRQIGQPVLAATVKLRPSSSSSFFFFLLTDKGSDMLIHVSDGSYGFERSAFLFERDV